MFLLPTSSVLELTVVNLDRTWKPPRRGPRTRRKKNSREAEDRENESNQEKKHLKSS